MRHTVAISDIHLCELEPTDGLWMRYRQAAYVPDRELASMLDSLSERMGGDDLELVLNGDVFDFDAPRVIDGESRFHNQPRDAQHAVPAMMAILRDHATFVDALGRLLARGHRVVLISGNHDVQLTLPEVRSTLRRALVEACKRAGGPADAGSRVEFRAWFYMNKDGVLFEHGNQYDQYCSYRFPLMPFHRDSRMIVPTFGSLAARNFAARMGYFNPHVDSSFMLSAFGYVRHWAKYYLFSRRSLAVAWLLGTIRSMVELVRRLDRGSRERRRQHLDACVRETGLSKRRLARHLRICATPADQTPARIARELWIDRLVLGGLALTMLAIGLFFARGPLAAIAALVPIAIVGLYELLMPKPGLDEVWNRVQRTARRVAKIHRARAVVFGHTHHAEGTWERGVFYGNTGSWSAAFRDVACTEPVSDEKPVIWLTCDDARAPRSLSGGLVHWKNGRFEAPPAPRKAPQATLIPTEK